MCQCATLPELIYLKSKPSGFESTLVELSVGNWVKLFRCSECKQLWRIDEWDKYQTQFAAKVPNVEGWGTYDTIPLQKQLLLQSRGGLSNSICNWARCGKHAVKGVMFCIDHLFETGTRE
jgi:hypothetical protein